MSTTCPSCGQNIIFIRDQDGTRLPVNKTRVRVYYGSVENREEWRYLKDATGRAPELYYVSHFLSCPAASEHSRAGRGS